MKANTPLRNSTTLGGTPLPRRGREVANVEKHHADLARLPGELRRPLEQAVDHGGRHVLAEQIRHLFARGRLVDGTPERVAQAHRHQARHHAGHEHDPRLGQVIERRQNRIVGRGGEGQHENDHEHVADGRHRPGEHRQHEIEPERRGHDEDEVEHRRPGAEGHRRTPVLADRPEEDAGQARLDDRVGKTERGEDRRAPPAATLQHQHGEALIDDERAEHAEGQPHREGLPGQGLHHVAEQEEEKLDGDQQRGERRGQHAYPNELARQNFVGQRALEVRGDRRNAHGPRRYTTLP